MLKHVLFQIQSDSLFLAEENKGRKFICSELRFPSNRLLVYTGLALGHTRRFSRVSSSDFLFSCLSSLLMYLKKQMYFSLGRLAMHTLDRKR